MPKIRYNRVGFYKSIALVSIAAQVVINCKVVVRFYQYSLLLLIKKQNNEESRINQQINRVSKTKKLG